MIHRPVVEEKEQLFKVLYLYYTNKTVNWIHPFQYVHIIYDDF